ncbi:IclR family transcriptional regulator [Natrinema sp. 1APR25-10V2]|uniref:IclR family transcriptional regulator n=1 Tax=Natrinema sp. 1APR25-10V2 TaxID=2951081 RepID=UPI002874EBBF|nr:IclR family transcriptional regulator [Natrinema sp. 1APR25-10V2]MDS0476910.1 IclR family transcriptional regulator [Natrinema sp. 1APR25-10V2]
MKEQSKTRAKTTQNSLEVVEALRELGGSTLEELSEYTGFSTSTVHRHLATLRDYNYVIQEDDVYRVGLQFLTMGGYAQREIDAYPVIKEKVDQLAVDTDERAQFIVEENGQRVYLYTEVGQSAVKTGARIGKRGELYTSAAGKAILANLPEEHVYEIIDMRGLSGEASNAITSKEALFETLEEIRERGYAFNKQETTDGVHAIGAAVTDANDEVLGALSVAGPAHRLKGDTLTEELPEQILGTVNELELHIQHSVS